MLAISIVFRDCCLPPQSQQRIDILSRVPAKYLLRLRCVCKAWKGIIDDQSLFVKSHTKKQQSSSSTILIRKEEGGALFCLSLDSLSVRVEELDLIPLKQIILRGVPRLTDLPTLSCNGLILIPHTNIKKSWAIWNPLLQDFHLLPPPPPETDLKSKHGSVLARCGFGYDEGSDDYKVVRVDQFSGKKVNDYYRTRVYSLKSRYWRTMDDFPGGDCLGDHGAFLDGALYWRSRDGVVALDLGGDGEAHRLVAPPPPSPNINNKQRWRESLDALDGCLIWSCFHQNPKRVEAWVMEADYSWTELYSVETADSICLRIVGYLKSKGRVFFSNYRGDGLRWLDIENNSWRDVRISRLFCSSNSPYIPTFALSFTQITPMSLVRLDNHRKNKNTSGVKRKWKKAYTQPKAYTPPKGYTRKRCGGLWRK